MAHRLDFPHCDCLTRYKEQSHTCVLMVYGLFVPKTFRSQYALDDSFPGRFVPWTFRSLDVSFSGRFVPRATIRNNMDTIVGPICVRYRAYKLYEVNLKTKYI